MNQEFVFTLEELSRETERRLMELGLNGGQPDGRVSAAPDGRTIRYYTTLGLLDPPVTEGRQARYGERHLRQLVAVKLLQSASLSLAEIQSRLYGRSDAELEALLETVRGAARPAASDPITPIYWREIVIEPGLKLMAEANWQPRQNLESLETRIRAALAALQATSTDGKRST